MGEFIIKAAPDVDLYALYCDNSETIDFTGPRAETETLLSTPTEYRGVQALGSPYGPAACLARADETGTSLMFGRSPLSGAWDDEGIRVATAAGGFGFLPRTRFRGYVEALHAGNAHAAEALLEPVDRALDDQERGDL